MGFDKTLFRPSKEAERVLKIARSLESNSSCHHIKDSQSEMISLNIAHKYRSQTNTQNRLRPFHRQPFLKVEQLLQLSDSLLRAGHAVADSARVLEDLVVVAALVGLVAEEVDGAVLDAADLLLGFDVLQAVGLVPASGEDVKGDLAADGVTVW